jgi:imidazolonepropionase-like amidohydrolase
MEAIILRLQSTKFFAIICCATAVTSTAHSQAFSQAQISSHDSYLIRRARIFDGRSVRGQFDVLIQDGRIKTIGRNIHPSEHVQVIHAEGDTLLPGLIDSHTHAYGTGLAEALIFGVTTELDMFTDPQYAATVRRDQASGKNTNQADLRSAGILATVPGGHGTEYGMNIPTLTAPSEAQSWVDARISEGSDYIKLVYDDYRAYGGHRPTLSKETLKAVIDAAHRRGKLTIVHIGDQQGAKDAIEAGADGLAHLFADSSPTPDFASLVARHNAFVVPTLTVLESLSGVAGGKSISADPRILPYLSSDDVRNLSQAFPQFHAHLSERFAEGTIRELMKAHVPVLAGTDAPNPGTTHGASIHRELELLVRSGMTPTTKFPKLAP